MTDLKAYEIRATIIKFGKRGGKDEFRNTPPFILRNCVSADAARVQVARMMNPFGDPGIGVRVDVMRDLTGPFKLV